MTTRSLARLKALTLILMAVCFASLLVEGQLFNYIGPRFSWLIFVAVGLLILLAGSFNLVGRDTGDSHMQLDPHGLDNPAEQDGLRSIMIMAIPLVLAILVPSKPLGASAIPVRGVSTEYAGGHRTPLPSNLPRRTVLDWAAAISTNHDPTALDGQKADLIGFVYRDARVKDNQFMLTRFAFTCCVADALAIGVVVQAREASKLDMDTWVRVVGSFKAGDLKGTMLPVLIADDVAPIQEPEQPYLYP